MLDMLSDDLNHVDVGHILGEQTLERHHTAGEHRHHAGQFDIILARQADERGQELADVEVLQIQAGKIGDDEVEVAEERGVVELGGIAPRHGEAHE